MLAIMYASDGLIEFSVSTRKTIERIELDIKQGDTKVKLAELSKEQLADLRDKIDAFLSVH